MLKFVPRTASDKAYIKYLYQACKIGRPAPTFDPSTHEVVDLNACELCLYWEQVTNESTYRACRVAHGCNYAKFPFIAMITPIMANVEGYTPTGIYRQIKFEGMPLYVQLFKSNAQQGQCNAECWWHSWRMNNKKTWRQCGQSHVCGNDASLWVLMAPNDQELYDEFIEQL